jgi:hypothetical protein
MAEVARPLRFLNLLIGLWLIGAPWLLTGGMSAATWNDVVAGLLVVCLSLPRGSRSTEHYGAGTGLSFEGYFRGSLFYGERQGSRS